MLRPALALLLCLPVLCSAVRARADEPAFCAERPGQTTPPCVTAPGHLMLESGLAAWQRQQDSESRTDSWSFGATQLRLGLGSSVEAQLGWQMLGSSRTTDPAGHPLGSASRVGDVTLGLLYGLAGTNGPVAVQLFASLPAGRPPIGAGDWGAGARLPIALPLGAGWQLGLTPEIDAAVNQSARGRHLAFGGAVGLGHAISNAVSFGMDLTMMRDSDPAGASTRAVATASLAWQANARTQFDFGGGAGLNHDSLDKQFYFGVARSF